MLHGKGKSPLGLRSEPMDADPLTAAGMVWGGCAQITCLSASSGDTPITLGSGYYPCANAENTNGGLVNMGSL